MKTLISTFFLLCSVIALSQETHVSKFESNKVTLNDLTNVHPAEVMNEYSLIVIDYDKMKVEITSAKIVLDIVSSTPTKVDGNMKTIVYNCTDAENKKCQFYLLSIDNTIKFMQVGYPSLSYIFEISNSR